MTTGRINQVTISLGFQHTKTNERDLLRGPHKRLERASDHRASLSDSAVVGRSEAGQINNGNSGGIQGEAGLPVRPSPRVSRGKKLPGGHLVLNRAKQRQTPARHPLPGLASQDRVRSVISTGDKTDKDSRDRLHGGELSAGPHAGRVGIVTRRAATHEPLNK